MRLCAEGCCSVNAHGGRSILFGSVIRNASTGRRLRSERQKPRLKVVQEQVCALHENHAYQQTSCAVPVDLWRWRGQSGLQEMVCQGLVLGREVFVDTRGLTKQRWLAAGTGLPSSSISPSFPTLRGRSRACSLHTWCAPQLFGLPAVSSYDDLQTTSL